ncbi:MAG: hypothetical protein WBP12_03500 [Candidatus Saccharimonas sp.]
MATGTKKPSITRKKPVKSRSRKPLPLRTRIGRSFTSVKQKVLLYRKNLLARRTHRSFQRTRRRDYLRGLTLPGYFALAAQVFGMLRAHWRTFILLVALYTAVIIVAGGVINQSSFTEVRELLTGTAEGSAGGLVGIGDAALATFTAFASLPTTITIEQQIYLALGGVLAWLCTVWLLREFLLGRKPRLRDGLYNSGGPLVATLAVALIIALQLIPVALLAVAYASLLSTGVVDSGFGAMLFWVFAALVVTLVLYWVTSSLFALVIVTLPGIYPFRAVRMASDIVLGRRLRILYRLLWGALMLLICWAVIIIPVSFATSLAASVWPWFDTIPITPYLGALLTAASTVWFATYVYLFYRRVVEND